MRIGIIGGGTVGRAMAQTWLEYCVEVRIWDLQAMRCTAPRDTTLNSDLVFVCLPEGEVEPFFRDMSDGWRRVNFVLKSTVPIGTTRRIAKEYGLDSIVHSPEFLTERCAMTDAQIPARNIIGIPGSKSSRKWCILSEEGDEPISREGAQPLQGLLLKRFPGVPVQLMSSDESEAVKLLTNAFFTAKVALFNEFKSLADRMGLAWETVRAGILSDGRIAHSHTTVPGPDGYGIKGRCLPKDLRTLCEQMRDAGADFPVLEATQKWTDDDRPLIKSAFAESMDKQRLPGEDAR